MVYGIIVGVAICIVAYCAYKAIARRKALKELKKALDKHDMRHVNCESRQINLKKVVGEHFQKQLEERNRILKEQKKMK